MKKNLIVDIECLAKDAMNRKMVQSNVGLTSSTTTKEVTSCGKMAIVGPLGLKSEETLHGVVRKRKTEAKQQTTIVDHMKK